MDKEKLYGIELNDIDLEQVSGGVGDEIATTYDRPPRSEPVQENDTCPFGTCGTCSSYRNGCCYYDGC